MRIAPFARAALLLAGSALVVLLAIMAYSLFSFGQVNDELERLASLQHRLSNLALPASGTLLANPQPSVQALFEAESRALIAETRAVGDAYPDARKAARRLEQLLAVNRAALVRDGSRPPRGDGRGSNGPLRLAPEAQATLRSVNELSMAASSALSDALTSARADIRRTSHLIHLLFMAATLLFGIACIATLAFIDRRIGGRLAELYDTVLRLRAGDRDSRATVAGSDELAALGLAFNQLVDSQERAKATLAREATLRRNLIDSMPANIATLDGDGLILDTNRRWREFGDRNGREAGHDQAGLNYLEICEAATGEAAADGQAVALGLREILAGERQDFVHEYPCHGPDRPAWYRMMARRLAEEPTADAAGGALVVMHIDVTDQRLAENRLRYLAFNDELTGLLSRRGLLQRIGDVPPADHCLLITLDLIGFHDVNESFGPAAGDEVLREVARRLQAIDAPACGLARTGSDTFALYFDRSDDAHRAAVEQQLDAALRVPFVLAQGKSVRLAANFGLHAAPAERPVDVEALYRRAETALFQARAQQVTRVLFTSTLEKESAARMELTRDLHQAVDNGELELHFQPQVNLQTGSLVSCEALLRWRHPVKGLQPPAEFIPLAEQSQLIVPIGSWVLREACRQLQAWRAAGLDVVSVAVNVSLIQFTAGDLVAQVEAALGESGIAASQLTLEVTESAFITDRRQMLATLIRLRSLGVRLSLDDFGTGYSSLEYLKDFPFQEVKIDQSFVRDLLEDRYSESIVQTVIAIARAIGAAPLAEGIEKPAIARRLAALGCPTGQGYYYSMPLEAEDFRWLLEEHARLPLQQH